MGIEPSDMWVGVNIKHPSWGPMSINWVPSDYALFTYPNIKIPHPLVVRAICLQVKNHFGEVKKRQFPKFPNSCCCHHSSIADHITSVHGNPIEEKQGALPVQGGAQGAHSWADGYHVRTIHLRGSLSEWNNVKYPDTIHSMRRNVYYRYIIISK